MTPFLSFVSKLISTVFTSGHASGQDVGDDVGLADGLTDGLYEGVRVGFTVGDNEGLSVGRTGRTPPQSLSMLKSTIAAEVQTITSIFFTPEVAPRSILTIELSPFAGIWIVLMTLLLAL